MNHKFLPKFFKRKILYKLIFKSIPTVFNSYKNATKFATLSAVIKTNCTLYKNRTGAR